MTSNPQTTDRAALVEAGLISIEQACELSSLGRTTIYAAMTTGELRFARIGRARRIPRRALLDWLAAHVVGGEQSAA
ncbi:MAG: helix-turn-helix domain-containing protein [Deltaproteobacteria bacterium]|nr:helix-turn-helix domain-containing protein [Deltaproteobacteria bacterium]